MAKEMARYRDRDGNYKTIISTRQYTSVHGDFLAQPPALEMQFNSNALTFNCTTH